MKFAFPSAHCVSICPVVTFNIEEKQIKDETGCMVVGSCLLPYCNADGTPATQKYKLVFPVEFQKVLQKVDPPNSRDYIEQKLPSGFSLVRMRRGRGEGSP